MNSDAILPPDNKTEEKLYEHALGTNQRTCPNFPTILSNSSYLLRTRVEIMEFITKRREELKEKAELTTKKRLKKQQESEKEKQEQARIKEEKLKAAE